MSIAERLKQIVEIITKKRTVSVNELSDHFKVTKETIRKDLEKLEYEGILRKIHGGAISLQQEGRLDLSFASRVEMNLDAKFIMAEKIAHLIKDGNHIFADSSTTVYQALVSLSSMKLTIMTNAVHIFGINSSSFNLISTGGEYKKFSNTFVGAVANKSVKDFFADIALISCTGVNSINGITESNAQEVYLKRLMIKNSKLVILLADSSKIGIVGLYKMINFYDINYLITDKTPPYELMTILQAHKIKVL